VAAGCGRSARAEVPRPHAAGAEALARPVAGAARLVECAGGGGTRTRPAHGGQLAGRLLAGRVQRRWPSCTRDVPPVLNPTQQTALKAAVRHPPREAGIDRRRALEGGATVCQRALRRHAVAQQPKYHTGCLQHTWTQDASYHASLASGMPAW
jgi:hypothetical protein